MLQREHSAILSTFIKLHVPVVIKTFILSILSARFTQISLYLEVVIAPYAYFTGQNENYNHT